MQTYFRRGGVLLLGLFVAVLLLEGGLRLAAGVFMWSQSRQNRAALEDGGEIVVLCIGESTTAMGANGDPAYPELLQEVHFVDNEASFTEALLSIPYEELFGDMCYGDFGHATRRGNLILATGIAGVIWAEVLGQQP